MDEQEVGFDEILSKVPRESWVGIAVNLLTLELLKADGRQHMYRICPEGGETPIMALVYRATVGDPLRELFEQVEAMAQFHPRAMKLLRKRKPFLVVAEDEPYYQQVYALIREHEQAAGRWTEDDERYYETVVGKNHENADASRNE